MKSFFYKFLSNIYCYNPMDDSITKNNEPILIDSSNGLINLVHPQTENVEVLIERNLSSVILQTTQNCNLCCSYCSFAQENTKSRKHNSSTMQWGIAKRAIDYLHSHSVDSDEMTLIFYGGEPLLNFDLITESVEYFEQKFIGKKRSYIMTTNATLLSDKILNFLNQYKFKLALSLDGDEEITDKNRKFRNSNESVFNNVINTIETICLKYPDLYNNLMLNMVLDPSIPYSNYKKLFDKYKHLNNLTINATLVNQDYMEKKIDICDDFKQDYYYDLFLMYLHISNKFDFKKQLQLLARSISVEQTLLFGSNDVLPLDHFIPSSQCIAGYDKLFVDVKGNYYPCEKTNENNSDLIIGNVYSGLDISKIKDILNFQKTLNLRCNSCFAIRHCSICSEKFFGKNYTEYMDEICEESKKYVLNYLVTKTIMNEIDYINSSGGGF